MERFLLKRRAGQKVNFKYIRNEGLKTQQTPGTFEVFDKFFTEQSFGIIIELGTYNGGFTLYLAKRQKHKVHSFDIKNYMDRRTVDKIKSFSAKIYFEDIFNSEKLTSLFSTDERVLLLCDNGFKAEEVKTFAPYLKNNDVIMAHDYFYDEEEFYNNTKWKACEIVERHFVYDYLKPYTPYDIMFKEVFWACKIKQI
jgi:hypothetical protein